MIKHNLTSLVSEQHNIRPQVNAQFLPPPPPLRLSQQPRPSAEPSNANIFNQLEQNDMLAKNAAAMMKLQATLNMSPQTVKVL